MAQTWEPDSVCVLGRRLFDIVDGWAGRPPSGRHAIVVTHRDADEWRGRPPHAPFSFVDGVMEAVRLGRELVGVDGTVTVSAGDIGGQVVAAGLPTRSRWTWRQCFAAAASGSSAR